MSRNPHIMARILRATTWPWLGPLVVVLLLAIEFRRTFSYGFLVTPDLFSIFPAVPAGDGLAPYLSKWNSANLGREYGQSLGGVLLAVPASLGLGGTALQAFVVLGLLFVSGAAIWHVARSHVRNPLAALLAPVLYFTGPNLFVLIFDASLDFAFYTLLPLMLLLALRIVRTPSWRDGACLAVVLAVDVAFEPFGLLFVIPFLVLVLAGSHLESPSKHRLLRSAMAFAFAWTAALLLNASYYIGNFGYFTSAGVAGAAEANLPVVEFAYGWSTPVNIFSLVGGGLLARYAAFYPPWALALLLLVSGFAMIPLAGLDAEDGGDVRLALALLLLASIGWIMLTDWGVTLPLLSAIPYLLVFNYPAVFYLYLGLAFALLAALGVDDLAGRLRPASRTALERSPEAPTGRSVLGRARRWTSRYGWIAAAALLVASSLAPAVFFLGPGDFRVLEAPTAIGFPPQWGAISPPSWEAIDNFVKEHGGIGDARTLVLPYPTFAGAPNLPGYSVDLANQPEYTGSNYTGPFFASNAAQEYMTATLESLIANRTDRIGVPLGLASVRYVIVDKELNFTGPPRWSWRSLVGAPSAFAQLLDHQRDLVVIHDDAILRVYENKDYRPYVQAFSSATVIREGVLAAPANRTVHRWGYGRSDWSSPLPPSRIANVTIRPNGYAINATNSAGNLSVEFWNGTQNPSVNATSDRLDNDGFYLATPPLPVADDRYVLHYAMDYGGPLTHQGGDLVLSGLDANRTVLWQTLASPSPGPRGKTSGDFSFEPVLTDPSTRAVTVTLVFPSQFGSAVPMTFRLTSLELAVAPLPPPPDMLAPLLLPDLPSNYPGRAGATVLWRQLGPDGIGLVSSAIADYLCFGMCDADPVHPWGQLYFAYNALEVQSGVASDTRAPGFLSGVDWHASGSATSAMALGSSPFESVWIRAQGNGTLSPYLDGNPLASINVGSTNLTWYEWTLNRTLSASTLTLATSGILDLDAIFLDGPAARSSPSLLPAMGVNTTQTSLTEYRGVVPRGTRVILLGQGFNRGWILETAGVRLEPIPGLGWANLFVLGNTTSAGSTPFVLSFTPETGHLALVALQAAVAVALAVYVLTPRLRKVGAGGLGFLRKGFHVRARQSEKQKGSE